MSKIYLIYIILVSLIEILAFIVGGIFSSIGFFVWSFSISVLVLYYVYKSCDTFLNDIKAKSFSSLIIYLVTIIMYCYFIGNLDYSDINGDATQQLADSLNLLKRSDFGYTSTSFLNYPARQYFICCLPTILFGRNILSLHLGFALPFLFSLTVLHYELRKYLRHYGLSESYASLAILALSCFPYITEYFMNFEQAIFPVSLSMLVVAIILRLGYNDSVSSLFFISVIGCLLPNSYTPSLALVGLLICFIVLYIVSIFVYDTEFYIDDDKERLKVASGLIATVLCILIFSICTLCSNSLSSGLKDVVVVKDIPEYIKSTLVDFFMDKNAVFFGLTSGVVIVYMFLSLTFHFRFRDAIIALWICGVVCFSGYFIGYTAYNKVWSLQRNMLIIPVLVVAVVLNLAIILRKYNIKCSFRPLYILFLMLSLYNFQQPHKSFTYFSFIQSYKYVFEYADEVLDSNDLKATDVFNICLVSNNNLYKNFGDYAEYFYPNANVYITDNITMNYSLPTFVFYDQIPIKGIDFEMKKFEDKRYNEEYTWYLIKY